MTIPTPLDRDVQTILAADTPLRIDRPQGVPRIKTVRGGLGTPQNQDDPSSSQLSYAAEVLSGALKDQKIVFLQETNTARILRGNMAAQTYEADTDVDPVTDNITIVDHGLVTGDGPMRMTVADDEDELPAGINTASTGILTLTGVVVDGNTVTIDGKVYTLNTVLGASDGDVLIGADADASLTNLVRAITLGAGSGTLYAAATTLHASVTAAEGAGDTMDVTAKAAGVIGDAIATISTLSAGSFGAVTLENGVDLDYFVIKVDDDDFRVALTRQDAQDDVQVDITADGSGTATILGTHNVAFPPALSIQDGSSGILIEAGEALELPAHSSYTLVGDTSAVTSFYFA